ncbi:BCHE [Branchiostoma lanceolatum]|uniref:Carboxylic ester hydrolase n=1 Tax=Branchiostoma lanceolatum TaxID=7740 RepID=A0A8K0EUI8_BRALA|nr:BCHE [Branchiostoma lanceolatum]
MAFLTLLMVLVLLSCTTSGSATDGPVVQTKDGPVRGMNVKEGQVFFGIPFAAPPTGDLRWRPPQPPKPWGPAIYNATKRSPVCIQYRCSPTDPDYSGQCPPPAERERKEDCLYLNVFVPSTASPVSRKPVIFFIHGGNFDECSAMGLLYDSRFFANKTDSVVVAANYRIGALGFLRAGTGKDAARGNYGLLDQVTALQWVQDNIAAFGGDENQVTLFGQSAGGYSVLFHLVNDESDKLFHKAIASSAPTGLYFRSQLESIIFGNDFAKILNCSAGDMKCMRAADVSKVRHAQGAVHNTVVNPLHITEVFEPWGPIVDGDMITSQMVQSFSSGKFQKKPLIIGSNTEEAVLFIYQAVSSPMSTNRYQQLVLAVFKTSAFSVLTKYPPTNKGDERPTLTTMATQFIFTCPTRNLLKSALRHGHSNTWLYIFAHSISDDKVWGGYPYCKGRVCHSADLPFEFQPLPLFPDYSFTPEEQVLADSMAYYYGNFAHTGNPNTPGTRHTSLSANQVLNWPSFGSTKDYTNMVYNVPKNSVVQGYLQDKCDFWDEENVYP